MPSAASAGEGFDGRRAWPVEPLLFAAQRPDSTMLNTAISAATITNTTLAARAKDFASRLHATFARLLPASTSPSFW